MMGSPLRRMAQEAKDELGRVIIPVRSRTHRPRRGEKILKNPRRGGRPEPARREHGRRHMIADKGLQNGTFPEPRASQVGKRRRSVVDLSHRAVAELGHHDITGRHQVGVVDVVDDHHLTADVFPLATHGRRHHRDGAGRQERAPNSSPVCCRNTRAEKHHPGVRGNLQPPSHSIARCRGPAADRFQARALVPPPTARFGLDHQPGRTRPLRQALTVSLQPRIVVVAVDPVPGEALHQDPRHREPVGGGEAHRGDVADDRSAAGSPNATGQLLEPRPMSETVECSNGFGHVLVQHRLLDHSHITRDVVIAETASAQAFGEELPRDRGEDLVPNGWTPPAAGVHHRTRPRRMAEPVRGDTPCERHRRRVDVDACTPRSPFPTHPPQCSPRPAPDTVPSHFVVRGTMTP
jgi:hypothetical protein